MARRQVAFSPERPTRIPTLQLAKWENGPAELDATLAASRTAFELWLLRLSLGAAAEQHGALYEILQLANISRPRVSTKARVRLRREAFHGRLGVARLRRLEEVSNQNREVAQPVSERRELHPDDIQPEE